MIGWIFRSTRKIHLVTISLTAFSWFILGIWYGWGYCFCTDWHLAVREKLGYKDSSTSYIHFLILKLTGADLSPQLVDYTTLIIFLFSLCMSIGMNIRDWRKRKLPAEKGPDQ